MISKQNGSRPPARARDGHTDPLPMWVTVTVVLGDFALMAFNVIVYGPQGYPTTICLAGVLAGYAGLNQYLRKKQADSGPSEDKDTPA